MERGDKAGPALCASCWNAASKKIYREAQDYRNTNKSLDLNITHQDDFLT